MLSSGPKRLLVTSFVKEEDALKTSCNPTVKTLLLFPVGVFGASVRVDMDGEPDL